MLRRGMDVRVVSFTSWVPRFAGRSRAVRAFAECPPAHRWGALQADYPRWLYYATRPLKSWGRFDPGGQNRVAWLTARSALLRTVREFRPDVLYTHHTLPNGYLAHGVRRALGVPYVITEHDFHGVSDCAHQPKRRAQFARVANAAGRVIAVAKRMEADLHRLFPRANSITVYNGADPVPRALLETPRPPELRDKTVVFSCGMFFERKAFPLLIQAFAKVAGRHPSAVLRIAGDGTERPAVEAAVRLAREQAGAAVADRIELLGYQPHDRVIQEMAWSDVFALIGWDEPFATVYSEALSTGTPILCASDGGINDVVRDGVHGYMIPPRNLDAAADALDRLLSDPAKRREMGRNAAELSARRLTWDANAADMLEVFRQVIAEDRAGGPGSTTAG